MKPYSYVIRFILFITLVLFFQNTVKSQLAVGVKEKIIEANSYFVFEEYKEALPIYLRVLEDWPGNNNLYYKIGVCLLNIKYKKDKSITFLERAVKHISNEYKENSWKEENAPLESWYQLGHAYRINNRLLDAIDAYTTFLGLINDDEYKMELVREQINNCINAKIMQSDSMYFQPLNLGDKINTKNSENRPVVSGDENTLIYISELKFYDALFYSKKVDGEWTYPINLMPELKIDEDAYPCSLNYDGTELYVYRSDHYDGNIYVTNLIDGQWTKLKKLNDNINTKFWESHASVSSDGKTLYFTSNRKGGLGGLDIYRSEKNKKGDWGMAENLGPVINTPYNEETPFISQNDKILFFSSYGHKNMGGYDVFYSSFNKEQNRWNEPLNLGSPINTTDNDLFFQPVKNGTFGYYAMYNKNNSFGGSDIYNFEVFSKLHPRLFKIAGNVSIPDSLKASTITAYLSNNTTKAAPKSISVDKNGDYEFEVGNGHYNVVVKSNDFISDSNNIVIKRAQKKSTEEFSVALKKDTLLNKPNIIAKPSDSKDMLVADTILNTDTDKALKLKIEFLKQGKLTIQTGVKSNIICIENFEIKKPSFTYKFLAISEKSFLKLTFTASDSNVSVVNVEVNSSVYSRPPSLDDM